MDTDSVSSDLFVYRKDSKTFKASTADPTIANIYDNHKEFLMRSAKTGNTLRFIHSVPDHARGKFYTALDYNTMAEYLLVITENR